MTGEQQHPNKEHVEWLKEGVEKWNARREKDSFTPDLEDADIYGEFNESRGFRRFRHSGPDELVDLKGINLQGANLKDADLSGVDFICANLQGADLTDARCSYADFTNAHLQCADLTGARCSDVDFTNAQLQRAILTNTRLSDANFTNANLKDAKLTNCDAAWDVNFTKANLQGADFTNAELRDGDFTDGDLQNTILTNAELMHANFTNANLQGVDFTSFKLESPEFKEANLQSANLIELDLSGVNLTKADLRRTKLGGTDLTDANLTNSGIRDVNLSEAIIVNANFAGAKPWKAMLYSDEDRTSSPCQYQSEFSPITTIGGLLEQIKTLQCHHNQGDTDESVSFYFRGEPECGWDLSPSVMRRPKDAEKKLSETEGGMLRELISRRPGEFNDAWSALAEWVLAQHHGLPTRFLDVTRNPLVALFNACKDDAKVKDGRLHVFAVPQTLIKQFNSDVISIVANLARLRRQEQKLLLGYKEDNLPYDEHEIAKLRLYQAIKQEKPYFEERIDIRDLYKVFVVEPRQFSERIRAQSGAFLVSAFHENFDRDAIVKVNKQNPPPVYAHYKLTIPKRDKNDIMGELSLLNITNETLFPGLDSSAEAVKGVYISP